MRGAHALLGFGTINQRAKEAWVEAYGNGHPTESEDRLARALEIADLAQQEIDRGFPLLHNHALVGLWGALEAAIDDVCTARILDSPEILESGDLSKVKVNAAEFIKLGDTDRARVVFEELKRVTDATMKVGVGQFERLLNAVGVGGDVDPHVRNVIRIAKEMRNVVAHRAGIVDARFVSACADLNFARGDQLRINREQMHSVLFACVLYVEEVNRRCRAAQGLPPLDSELPPGLGATSDLMSPFGA